MTDDDETESLKGPVRVRRRKAALGGPEFPIIQSSSGKVELRARAPADEVRDAIDIFKRVASDAIVEAGKDPVNARRIARLGQVKEAGAVGVRIILLQKNSREGR